jgi:release factor glutamine methyltransferase
VAGYRPTVPRDVVARIRAWHERTYSDLRERDATQPIVYLGRTFLVPAQVFPPMSELLGQAVLREVRGADRVLDMGTGSGVNAILAASESTEVVAVDISPVAVECARRNAASNAVASRIAFRESDVFERVEGRFDLIIFDPPFRWFAPRDVLEAAITDEDYGALTRFMRNARSHLRAGGRILLFFGTSADLGYLSSLIDRSGFAREVVSRQMLTKDNWTVEYFVFRLTAGVSPATPA